MDGTSQRFQRNNNGRWNCSKHFLLLSSGQEGSVRPPAALPGVQKTSGLYRRFRSPANNFKPLPVPCNSILELHSPKMKRE